MEILVTDPDWRLIDYCLAKLHAMGHTIRIVSSPSEALNVLQTDAPHAVIAHPSALNQWQQATDQGLFRCIAPNRICVSVCVGDPFFWYQSWIDTGCHVIFKPLVDADHLLVLLGGRKGMSLDCSKDQPRAG